MKELISGEKPKAVCFLREEGNSDYMLELTNMRLVATVNRRESEFYVDSIQRLEFNHRKQILLVIYGGIAIPLSTVALFGNIINPIILLLFIFSGLFAFYIGWTGNPVLSVILVAGHQDILVQSISNNLKEFVEFANSIRHTTEQGKLLFFYLLPNDQRIDEAVDLLKRGNKCRLYTTEMIKKNIDEGLIKHDHLLVGIDPFRAGVEIKYERIGEEGTMIPYINGKLDPKSIIISGYVLNIIK